MGRGPTIAIIKKKMPLDPFLLHRSTTAARLPLPNPPIASLPNPRRRKRGALRRAAAAAATPASSSFSSISIHMYRLGASSCRRAAAFFALANRIYSAPTSLANANPISRLGTIPNRSGVLEEKKVKKGFGKTKNRRFLYMVDFWRRDSSFRRLRRIDPSSLFHAPPLDRAAAPSPAAVEDALLPPTNMTFLPPGSNTGAGNITWMKIMRRNDDKIVAVDQAGRAILYDPAKHSVGALPTMVTPKPLALWLAVGKDLYVMAVTPHRDSVTERSFEALVRCKKPEWEEGDDCLWRPMPPVPYVHAADREHAVDRRHAVDEICAYAAVGDSHILLSTRRHGTYSFDTASSTWSKAGDWTLPFCDHAEYVPEHGLWFGFSAEDDGVLGAWDLSSSTVQQPEPPAAAHCGCRDFAVPGPARRKARQSHVTEVPSSDGIDFGDVTEVQSSHIVHLGDSKLCVAKLYKVSRRGTCSKFCCDFEWDKRSFAVLTGVEVVRSHEDKLRIIKHKSQRYSFGERYAPISVL